MIDTLASFFKRIKIGQWNSQCFSLLTYSVFQLFSYVDLQIKMWMALHNTSTPFILLHLYIYLFYKSKYFNKNLIICKYTSMKTKLIWNLFSNKEWVSFPILYLIQCKTNSESLCIISQQYLVSEYSFFRIFLGFFSFHYFWKHESTKDTRYTTLSFNISPVTIQFHKWNFGNRRQFLFITQSLLMQLNKIL